MRIAIAWEDEYFLPLQRLVLARRSVLRPAAADDYLDLVQYTLRGNGKFARHVEDMWPRARALGVANDPGPLAHLICVVDGDKLSDLLPAVGQAPLHPDEVAGWHAAAERTFEEHLRARATNDEPSTVHGIVLRWAKESLALAAYDRAAVADKLGVPGTDPELKAFLSRCKPSPDAVSSALFSDTYRRPVRCLDDLRNAQGLAPVGKGVALDDVIGAIRAEDVGVVCERVPDVDRLIALAWRLTSAPTDAAPRARDPIALKAKSKASRKR